MLFPDLSSVCLLALPLVSADATALPVDEWEELRAQLDRVASQAYEAGGPGAAVLVEIDGVPVLNKGYGLSELEHEVAIAPQTVFRIGSITKQFTATAVLTFLEAGRLQLEDPVAKHLPRFELDETITVAHLLGHTSGIASYTSMPAFWEGSRKDWGLDELIQLALDEGPQFAPGERYAYCNTGYVLLGALVEKLSGKSYADYLQEALFEPAGMQATLFGDHQAIVPHRAEGYERGPEGWVNDNYLSFTGPHAAGALLSTTGDLARWTNAILNGQILQPDTLEVAFTSHRLNDGQATGYACGWEVGSSQGRPFIEHGGGINGFSTVAISYLDHGVFVAVLCNAAQPMTGPGDLGHRLAKIALQF